MSTYNLAALVFTWFNFVSLSKTTLPNSGVYMSEPPLNCRKINWGWGCLEVDKRLEVLIKIIVHIQEGITFLNCQLNVFWLSIAVIIAAY